MGKGKEIKKFNKDSHRSYITKQDAYGHKFQINERSNQLEILAFDEDREIWEKQDCETEDAYERFMIYCTERQRNGKEYRLADVAKHLDMKVTGIRNQSSNMKWRQRREAYRDYEKEIFKERVRHNIYNKVDQRFAQMQMMDDLIEGTLKDGINTKKMTELSKITAIEKVANTMLKLQDSFMQIVSKDIVSTKDGFTTKDGGITITFQSKKPEADNE